MPFFSIVIPSYNRGHLLSDTIQSVQEQDFTDWELIVVDDGSTDQTKEIVDEWSRQDARVSYVYQSNAERGAARNNGFSKSSGKYICFLDSDDHFLPQHLSLLHSNILSKNEPTALFFTNSLVKDKTGQISKRLCPAIENYDVLDYILTYTFNPARVAVQRDIMEDLKFDPTIPGLEDLDLWLRIALKYPVHQIKERTILYNLHEETYTVGDLQRFEKELKNFKYIFNKPSLKGHLMQKTCDRLLSMCHYHLAVKADSENNKRSVYYHALSSILLFPKGYNGKTNKPLMVMMLYHLPFIGAIMKYIIRSAKNT